MHIKLILAHAISRKILFMFVECGLNRWAEWWIKHWQWQQWIHHHKLRLVFSINEACTLSMISAWPHDMVWRCWFQPILNLQPTSTKSFNNCKVYTAKDTILHVIFTRLQTTEWLKSNTISKLVIVIKSKETLEVLERWNFNIEVNGENGLPMAENIPPDQ